MNADAGNPHVYSGSKVALNTITLAMSIEVEQSSIRSTPFPQGFIIRNLNKYAGSAGSRKAPRRWFNL
jgi:NAD(P)-dependent dehydrogenase (short-subunit alcohol dehydrogenase family)